MLAGKDWKDFQYSHLSYSKLCGLRRVGSQPFSSIYSLLELKVNKFAVLVDRHKKVYRKVNIDRLESGPIRGYIFGNWRENSNCGKMNTFLWRSTKTPNGKFIHLYKGA
jgi:hypothetical protein